MTKAKIENLLTESLQPQYLEVIDESHKHIGHAGAKQGGHFAVKIISTAFEGKTALERHRMIYQALEPIKGLIHALSIQAQKSS